MGRDRSAVVLLALCTAMEASARVHGADKSLTTLQVSDWGRKQPLCSGSSCRSMSVLLPQLRFKQLHKVLTCTCSDVLAARCFAPGCFPCDKSCFADDPALANEPGPFGTGLLCSIGCYACCQAKNDPDRAPNSTCLLVGEPCVSVS